MQDYRKLQAWQRAQEACVRLYRLTGRYPAEEKYGLATQLRRAGVSVTPPATRSPRWSSSEAESTRSPPRRMA